ncbi:uncharacterized protein LOC105698983 [Orussus abietinus]|uniref:uncharacterized protein LOC105698983 n=1 Tax=Orussus abietinus TaxID=222816 RepID=UPI0006267C3C|nr:uncharacterized protein LOC105698983 [Orussus abietinus]
MFCRTIPFRFIFPKKRALYFVQYAGVSSHNFICNEIVTNLVSGSTRLAPTYDQTFLVTKRFKYDKRVTKKEEEEDEDESEDIDEAIDIPLSKSSKVLKTTVPSARADAVLKAGLNTSRSNVETAFYESCIRLNGSKLLKKSELVKPGDQLDLIKGRNLQNPDFLNVDRIEIVSMDSTSNGFKVKLVRDKGLVIENYDDPWKSTTI